MIQRNKIQENVFNDIWSKIKYFACSRSLRTKQRSWILVDLVSKRFVNKKKKEHANIFYLSIISSGANFLVLCHSMKKPGCEWLDEILESKMRTFTYLCSHPCFFPWQFIPLHEYQYAVALVRWYMDFLSFRNNWISTKNAERWSSIKLPLSL